MSSELRFTSEEEANAWAHVAVYGECCPGDPVCYCDIGWICDGRCHANDWYADDEDDDL